MTIFQINSFVHRELYTYRLHLNITTTRLARSVTTGGGGALYDITLHSIITISPSR